MESFDFDYSLPKGLIAQTPLERRDASRLMVVRRGLSADTLPSAAEAGSGFRHRQFDELPELLRPKDLLVVNDSRVIPARLLGRKRETLGRAELLLLRPVAGSAAEALRRRPESVEWICLGQASKGLRDGARLDFAEGLSACIVAATAGGEYRVRFEVSSDRDLTLATLLDRVGVLPLPPYIERPPGPEDLERYQTVYSNSLGSVAAPTAGLHFTPELLGRLEARGVKRVPITLDVGAGTFLPVRDGKLSDHKMHPEQFTIPSETVEAIARTRAEGGRVVAVGTTVVRALESATDPATNALKLGPGETALFIHPPYMFRQVDALITNFHLPRSTLLMLVCAFLGRDRTLAACSEAVRAGYRFFSYGDAMFIDGEPRQCQ